MPVTKRGIYHNLLESKYVISNREMTFFFSSEFYRDKFMDGYQQNRQKFNKFFNRNNVTMNFEWIADVSFYSMTEKRGFRCRVKGVELSCQEAFQYALGRKMNKSIEDWFVIPVQK